MNTVCYCEQCGTDLPANARFCRRCGLGRHGQRPQASEPPPPSHQTMASATPAGFISRQFIDSYDNALVITIAGTILGYGLLSLDVFSLVDERTKPLIGSIFLLLSIVIVISASILLYRWWDVLPQDWRRTTPGKAVGYSFIPFYCFYWWFVAYAGLAADINKFMETYQIRATRVSVDVAVSSCVLSLLSFVVCFIPSVSYLLGIASLVMYIVLAISLTNACKAIIRYRDRV